MSSLTVTPSGSALALHHPDFQPLTEIVACWSLPGGGKDELGKRLSQIHDWGHLSCSTTLKQLDQAFPLLEICEGQRRGEKINDDLVLAGLMIRVLEFCKIRPSSGRLLIQGCLRTRGQIEAQIDLFCRFASSVTVLKLGVSPDIAFERITKNPRQGRIDGDNPAVVRKRIQDDSAIADVLERDIACHVGRLSKKGYDVHQVTVDTSNKNAEQVAEYVAKLKHRLRQI